MSPSAPHPAEYTAPLILIGDGEVRLFRTTEDVALAIEPVDALEVDLALFDAEGLVFAVEGVDVRRTRFTVGGGRTVVSVPEPRRFRSDELAVALREYLGRVFGLPEGAAALSALVERAESRIGYG